MALAFSIMLLGHIIGDFYVQSDKLAKEKERSKKACAKHCLIYALCMAVFVALLATSGASICSVAGVLAVLGASHALVDFLLRPLLNRATDNELLVFFVDQLIHLVFIVICALCITPNIETLFCNESLVMALLLIALICGKPISIVVKLALRKTRRGNASCENQYDGIEAHESDGAGTAIGILERFIVALLTYLGQYEAIAFVIAAKSIARFKRLEDQEFAETYIIGTLSSVLLAMLTVIGIKALLL